MKELKEKLCKRNYKNIMIKGPVYSQNTKENIIKLKYFYSLLQKQYEGKYIYLLLLKLRH